MANEADGARQFEKGLRRLADAVILAYDEVEPTPPIMYVLRRELGPLLEAADAVIDEWSQPGQEDPISLYSAKPLQKELDKWRS